MATVLGTSGAVASPGGNSSVVTIRDRIFGFVPRDGDPNGLLGTRLLRLKVIAGHGLAKKDIFGASDPYLRIDLIDGRSEEVEDTVVTKTKKRTLNPKWNEEFVFRVKPADHKLVLEVFDENRLTRDDFLGMVELPLATMPRESGAGEASRPPIPHKHYILRPRSARSKVRGHLQLYHAFLAESEPGAGGFDQAEDGGSGGGGGVNRNIIVGARRESSDLMSSGAIPGQPLGLTGWEMVATNVPAASSLDGTASASEEPFIVESSSSASTAAAATSASSAAAGATAASADSDGGGGVSAASVSGSSVDRGGHPSLPPGWEERQDNNGRTYYVNHVSRTTQWAHPGRSEAELPGPPAHRQRVHISMDDQPVSRSGSQMFPQAAAASVDSGGGLDSTMSQMNINENSGSGEAVATAATTAATDQVDASGAAAATAATAAEEGEGGAAASVDSASASAAAAAATEAAEARSSGLPTSAAAAAQAQAAADSGSRGNSGNGSNGSGSGGGVGGRSGSSTSSGSGNATGQAEGLPQGWGLQVAPNGRVFFINHADKKTTWVDPRTGRPSPLPNHDNVPNRRHEDDLGPLPEGWEERVHTDGRIFFIDHNTRATQWEDPRISNTALAGPAIPYNRDYKRKYEFLKSQLKKPSNVPNKLDIKVRRAHLFEDSYRQIMAVPTNRVDILKTKLWIEFDGEMGLDYGGVAREWFYLLSKDMFNPYYGLFEYSATDNYTLQINPYSGVCNEDHLSYFKFIGRVAGMAVYHGKLLDGFFIRPFYKMMLAKSIELKDMESVDTEYYKSLCWIKENDPSEMELTFQVDEENFGQIISRELKPGGAKVSVTDENKEEYIQKVINWRFVSRIQKQMNSFLEGFNELVALNLLKIFDEGELELLMCGIGAIDVKDWKQNTVYKGDYHANHIVIQWFWRVVLSFNNEMRSRLLQFVTGTSRVPMNGFKELYGSNGPQPFTIEKIGNPNSFPRAHTCFNRLDLPPYESYQQLKEKMVRAIEGSEGFAGVD